MLFTSLPAELAPEIERAPTTPLRRIFLDEMGRDTSNDYWTGTTGTAGGCIASSSTCDDWAATSSTSTGTYGTGAATTGWTDGANAYCYETFALLCIEQ